MCSPGHAKAESLLHSRGGLAVGGDQHRTAVSHKPLQSAGQPLQAARVPESDDQVFRRLLDGVRQSLERLQIQGLFAENIAKGMGPAKTRAGCAATGAGAWRSQRADSRPPSAGQIWARRAAACLMRGLPWPGKRVRDGPCRRHRPAGDRCRAHNGPARTGRPGGRRRSGVPSDAAASPAAMARWFQLRDSGPSWSSDRYSNAWITSARVDTVRGSTGQGPSCQLRRS